jgi:hypothetical protein
MKNIKGGGNAPKKWNSRTQGGGGQGFVQLKQGQKPQIGQRKPEKTVLKVNFSRKRLFKRLK